MNSDHERFLEDVYLVDCTVDWVKNHKYLLKEQNTFNTDKNTKNTFGVRI